MRKTEPAADPGDPIRARVLRLLHAPILALLFALGLAPVVLLLPLLPAEPGTDPTLRPVELWIGTALIGGLAGTIEGGARPLYRVAGLVLAAGLLSVPVLRVLLWSDLPVPHGLAGWIGLDGEGALDADLYEVWLMAWLVCLGLALLGWHLLGRHLLSRRVGNGRAAVG